MPSTRAALRSQAPHENPDIAITTSPSTTPSAPKRNPLGEITGNQEDVPIAVDDPEEILTANRGTAKGKKGKSSKKSKKDAQQPNNDESGKVLPDENESETSYAVDNACQDLLKDQTPGTSKMVVHEDRPSTPPSPAVAEATQQLSTPPVLQEWAETASIENDVVNKGTDEHPATSVPAEKQLSPSCSPNQMPQEAQPENEGAGRQDNDASGQEMMKSPTRIAMRPEDSIEAIDKFEEEMEKVGDLMPTIKKHGQSPKERKANAETDTATKARTGSKGPATTQARNVPHSKRNTSMVNPKMAAKKGAAVVATAESKTNNTKTDPQTRKVSDSSSTSENNISAAAKKRVSSVHKAPFVPAKSTKPPTRASFELPGEAVARKLKEAREERMKREEEEKDVTKKTPFKARRVRLSQAPVVKPTATSRARISMAKGETPAAVSTKKNATLKPKPNPTSRSSDVLNGDVGRRLSTLSVNKRSASTSANTSARLNRAPSTTAPNFQQITKGRLSMQPPVRESITAADAAQMKAKGKSIYNRGRIEHDELEQMKKDKEEAARKARADAAERGRIASREWAEKQKAKKVAAKKGNAEVVVGGETSGSG
ncbi:MAG: hypothetical protein Q9221_003147 [Calogaya cf. arnoldii]